MTTLLPEREVGQAGLLGLGGGHPNSHSLHPSLLPHPLSRDAQQEAHLGDHLPPPAPPQNNSTSKSHTLELCFTLETGEEREKIYPSTTEIGWGRAGRSPLGIWQ